ncbi:ATP-binding protein [Brachybacterium phenoliresistens]|uniref:ATP-binding protein n=1 Tax=Brachybacterium phenoliresistens TaxID=396014 RepID=UPI0031DE4954
MEYLPRAVDRVLDELMEDAAAISLDGAKGVGKSGTALRRADHAWFLDDPDQAMQLQADPRFISAPEGTLLLDEWQLDPPIWDSVRRRVDEGAPAGRFLLTGSASPASARGTHSGAGRILSLHMRPMALHERRGAATTVRLADLMAGDAEIAGRSSWSLADYVDAIVASGFPGIASGPARSIGRQLDSYLARIIDRGIPDLGASVRRPQTFRRWLAAYAAASSTTTSHAKILEAAASEDGSRPAKTTAIAYRDHLAQLWVLDEVPAWEPFRVSLGRISQSPKHQLVDPALAARALGLSSSALLSARGAHMIGPLFESLATLSVRAAAQVVDGRVGHLRSRNGDREVDLIVEGPDGRVVAFEVKLSTTVRDDDVRHLLWLRRQLRDDVADLVVLTTGEAAYRRPDGVAVIPLALLGH